MPLTYLITGGSTKNNNFTRLQRLAEAAVTARISYFQIREKQLNARALFELVTLVMQIAHGSETKVLINDRLDVALAAGADGVHLAADSLTPEMVKHRFGSTVLVGASVHSVAEAERARDQAADLAVLGPIFATPDKWVYGPPLGLAVLRAAVRATPSFPLFALGGIGPENFAECLASGASGIAGIRIFGDPESVVQIAAEIRGRPFPTDINEL